MVPFRWWIFLRLITPLFYPMMQHYEVQPPACWAQIASSLLFPVPICRRIDLFFNSLDNSTRCASIFRACPFYFRRIFRNRNSNIFRRISPRWYSAISALLSSSSPTRPIFGSLGRLPSLPTRPNSTDNYYWISHRQFPFSPCLFVADFIPDLTKTPNFLGKTAAFLRRSFPNVRTLPTPDAPSG